MLTTLLTNLDKILTFVLTLGFLVFFHELGHFAVAKLFKVPVFEFAFGLPFGKKFLLFKRGGTEYTIRPVVPLGGFVAFADPEAEPETQLAQMEEYNSKPIWQRFLVIAAGPAASLLLGFLLYVATGALLGVPDENARPILRQVAAGKPAEKAGLKVGDEILSVDGQTRNVEGLIAAISASPGKAMTFVVKRKDSSAPLTVTVTPREELDAGKKVGRIGIGPGSDSRPMKDIGEAFRFGADATIGNLKAFRQIFSSFKQVKDNIGGPVGIAGAVSQATETGFWAKLGLAASLSVSLFVFNCFVPIPALDCGQMVLLIVEAIRRKRLSNEQQSRVMIASWAVLLTFFVVVTFNDIRKLIPGQH